MIQNTFILRRPRVSNFAGVIKITILFRKKIKKHIKKESERIRNYVLTWRACLYFLIWQKLLISGENNIMSTKLEDCVTWCISFWIFFRSDATVPRFITLGYVWKSLGTHAVLPPPIREQPSNDPSWTGLRGFMFYWMAAKDVHENI